MTARDLLHILRDGWLIIVASAVLITAGGAFYAATRTPLYESTATLVVSACVAVENLDSCDPVSGISYAVQRAKIYAGSAVSAPVLRETLEHTDAVTTRKNLSEILAVSQQVDSPLIEVSATFTDANESAEIANAHAESLIRYSRESIDNFESEGTRVLVAVVSEALPPVEPVASGNKTVELAALLGLLLGLGIAILRWLLNTRIRDADDAERITGLDVLAELPLEKVTPDRILSERAPRVANAFHELRTIVTSRRPEPHVSWTVAIVTPTDSSLATAVARGLAESLAATRHSVGLFLLDNPGDLGEATHDIGRVVSGEVSAMDFLSGGSQESPFVAAFAESSTARALAMSTPEFSELLSVARNNAETLVIDAAPDSHGSEMIAATRHADTTLVVIEVGVTTAGELTSMLRALELVQVPSVGIALVTRPGRRE